MENPLDVAVAIGSSEALFIAAAAGYPCGKDEYELAGALQKRAELIKCSSIDSTTSRYGDTIEGHFAKRTGSGCPIITRAKPVESQGILFEATRILFRNSPIFRGAICRHPRAETYSYFGALGSGGYLIFRFTAEEALKFSSERTPIKASSLRVESAQKCCEWGHFAARAAKTHSGAVKPADYLKPSHKCSDVAETAALTSETVGTLRIINLRRFPL